MPDVQRYLREEEDNRFSASLDKTLSFDYLTKNEQKAYTKLNNSLARLLGNALVFERKDNELFNKQVKILKTNLSATRALLDGVDEAYDKGLMNSWFRINREAIATQLAGVRGE